MNKKIIGLIIALVVLVIILGIFMSQEEQEGETLRITNFEECVEAGFPVMESYPEQCSDGEETYTRDIGNEIEKSDLIRLDNPRPGDTLFHNQSYALSGEARGHWFFEASFPFQILSNEGDELFAHYATAQGEWMTENFVPFTTEFTLDTEYVGPATLVLKRDNPSGLPENDDELIVPVVISENTEASATPRESDFDLIPEDDPRDAPEPPVVSGGCFVGGCSSQICSENPDMMSTCEWREEYGCYANATCE
ncbi:MAG: Gmad2 immunoglobulin-like domain-containing protein, partial [Candidatus Paceibacterota bacterium]